MRSKSFYLTTMVIIIFSIISCAGTQVELERSEIKYSKPQTTTDLIEGEKVEYQLWFDKNKWRVLDHENPAFKAIDVEAKKRNASVYNAMMHNSNEVLAAIEESRLPSNLETLYKYKSKSIINSGGYIIDKEIRTVNGSDVLYMRSSVTQDSVSYIILIYLFSAKSGVAGVLVSTSDNLFEEHESDMFDLLNGIVDPKVITRPVKSDDDIEPKLLKLKNLRDKGLITQEDFDNKKNELLKSY